MFVGKEKKSCVLRKMVKANDNNNMWKVILVLLSSVVVVTNGFEMPKLDQSLMVSRRSVLLFPAAAAVWGVVATNVSPASAAAPDLQFVTAKSGLQWADAKVGASGGSAMVKGSTVSVDYVMSTTGARYGSKIYSTSESNDAYRWTLGDGSTIAGLEQAILGGDGVPPMLPGGIRRLIIPSDLGYTALAKDTFQCKEGGNLGPLPPASTAFGEYQRFKNIYCNPNRAYQPDIVMDIKLYGRRAP